MRATAATGCPSGADIAPLKAGRTWLVRAELHAKAKENAEVCRLR
jgi:hypothetical protein